MISPKSMKIRQQHTLCKRNVYKRNAMTYEHSGVSIDNGNDFVRRITQLNPTIGGFSGFVYLGDKVLVASTDGVGTKLKIATAMEKHDTIGIDLVAMSVNDIITCGAKPLLFLDYFATGYLDVDVAETVIKGINEGCNMSGCVLLGGETAEMPGFYRTGDYDLAGFAVGTVDKNKVIDGKTIEKDDIVIGIPSTGVHSNGFSLVRKVLTNRRVPLTSQCPWSDNMTDIGTELLTPTRIYVKEVLELVEKVNIKGISHITGGGMTENIPRMFPKDSNLGVHILRGAWEVPEVFRYIQKMGAVNEKEMRRVFNMGIGLVMVIGHEDMNAVSEVFPDAQVIGMVVEGVNGVEYI